MNIIQLTSRLYQIGYRLEALKVYDMEIVSIDGNRAKIRNNFEVDLEREINYLIFPMMAISFFRLVMNAKY